MTTEEKEESPSSYKGGETAEELAEQIMGAGQFGGSLEACALLIELYASKKLEECHQAASEMTEALQYCHKRMAQAYSEIASLEKKLEAYRISNQGYSVEDMKAAYPFR